MQPEHLRIHSVGLPFLPLRRRRPAQEVTKMHEQIVNFNLEGMSYAGFLQACDEQFAPAFANVPGLPYKLWLSDPASNTYGGVYAWRDRQAMQDYMASDLFKAVASNPSFANITSQDYDILEGPSRVTHGLSEARVWLPQVAAPAFASESRPIESRGLARTW